MGILDRVARVVRANINDLLDSAEDPEKLFDQHILDMEEAIKEAKRKVVEVVAQEQQDRRALETRKADAGKWYARAEEAVKAGDDDLAKQALGVRRGVLGDVAELERQVEVQAEYTKTLQSSVDALERKVAGAKEERKRIKVELAKKRMRDAAARHTPRPRPVDRTALDDEDSFDLFDRMEGKIEMEDFEAEAMRELDAEVRSDAYDEAELERRFQGLAQEQEADDDLADLKKKLDGDP